jgi:hypothetical protein
VNESSEVLAAETGRDGESTGDARCDFQMCLFLLWSALCPGNIELPVQALGPDGQPNSRRGE